MNMSSSLIPFKTHPSVRIKGTENIFNPVQCVDASCENKSTPHLHCPFCVKTDYYQDPVILKAHYRVKHVDKGADWAGLKILRCCDRCYVVGSIKGEKVFKGPHWHCYKCRNGFNRRDEALKHYKTHFRNPQTTFQIQVSEDVNPKHELVQGEQVVAAQTLTQEDFIAVQPTLAQVMQDGQVLTEVESSQLQSERGQQGELLVSVAANETVETPEGQTIMIIQEKLVDSPTTTNGEDGNLHIALPEIDGASGDKDKIEFLTSHVAELEAKYKQEQEEKAQLVESLHNEIQKLKSKVEQQEQQIHLHQEREKELLEELSVPVDMKVQDLLVKLQTEHTDMLHKHLITLKQSYVHSLNKPALSHNTALPDTQIHEIEVNESNLIKMVPFVLTSDLNSKNSETTADGETAQISVSGIADNLNLDGSESTQMSKKRKLEEESDDNEINLKHEKHDGL